MSRLGADLERDLVRIPPPSFEIGDLARRRRRRTRLRRIEAGVVALAVAGLGALVLARSVPSGPSEPVAPSHPHVVTSFPAGARASGIAFADGSIWVGHRTLAELWRQDPATGRVQTRIPTGAEAPTAVAAGDGQVWALTPSASGSTILRVDPASDTVVASYPINVIGSSVAVGEGRVWVPSPTGNVVLVLSTSGRKLARIPLLGGPSAVSLDPGGAWVAGSLDGRLTRIALPGYRATAVANIAGRPTGVAACGRSLWISTGAGILSRVDGRTYAVTSTREGRFLAAVGADGAVVWTVDGSTGRAVALDCTTGKRLGRVRAGREPTGIAVSSGGAWIVDSGAGLVTSVAVSGSTTAQGGSR